jgi:DNA-binding response OmpR family regulator
LRATYQLLLLDLVLPGYSGFEILEAIKKERPGQPVIILSARGEENDRVRGLKMGADDYIVKPFSVRELLARVDAVLRRSTERPSVVETHQINGGEVDFARREIRFEDGDREELSERESELLRYLVAQSGRAVPRDELLRQVWGLDPKNIETRTVDMHVAHLRQKLRCQNAVVTVRGKGYMIGS